MPDFLTSDDGHSSDANHAYRLDCDRYIRPDIGPDTG